MYFFKSIFGGAKKAEPEAANQPQQGTTVVVQGPKAGPGTSVMGGAPSKLAAPSNQTNATVKPGGPVTPTQTPPVATHDRRLAKSNVKEPQKASPAPVPADKKTPVDKKVSTVAAPVGARKKPSAESKDKDDENIKTEFEQIAAPVRPAKSRSSSDYVKNKRQKPLEVREKGEADTDGESQPDPAEPEQAVPHLLTPEAPMESEATKTDTEKTADTVPSEHQP